MLNNNECAPPIGDSKCEWGISMNKLNIHSFTL